MQLRFTFDLVCPYAFLAATQVEGLAARFGAEVVYEPALLGGIFRAQGRPQIPSESWAPAKQRWNLADLDRQARRWGVPLRTPPGHPQRTVDAMRLIHAAPVGKRPALTGALYRAAWQEGRDLGDPAELARIALDHGLDPSRIKAPEVRQALFDATAAAAARGVFGVPTMTVGERSWWGVDRLHLVASALAGRKVEPPEILPPVPLTPGPATVRIFHDFASPFSYLASTRIQQICAQTGATLDWRPILLGALFKSIGTPMVPMATFSPERQRGVLADLHAWAERWEVPFTWPSCFPVRTVLPLRVALQEPRATGPLYQALWAEGRDIGDPGVVAEVLHQAGLDAAALIEGAEGHQVKALLRAHTEEAERRDVCGVPTMIVERPDRSDLLLWGQDRLPMLAEILAGWEG